MMSVLYVEARDTGRDAAERQKPKTTEKANTAAILADTETKPQRESKARHMGKVLII